MDHALAAVLGGDPLNSPESNNAAQSTYGCCLMKIFNYIRNYRGEYLAAKADDELILLIVVIMGAKGCLT